MQNENTIAVSQTEFQILFNQIADLKKTVESLNVHKPPMYYCVDDTRRMLGNISRSTLAEYTKEGIIDAHRLGTRILYNEQDIVAAVKKIKYTAK